MIQRNRLLACFLAIASARGVVSPDKLGSDVSIIINNDLLGMITLSIKMRR